MISYYSDPCGYFLGWVEEGKEAVPAGKGRYGSTLPLEGTSNLEPPTCLWSQDILPFKELRLYYHRNGTVLFAI